MLALELGYCLQMYSSGPSFKGIKMIPPGIHFIYYSSSNRLVSLIDELICCIFSVAITLFTRCESSNLYHCGIGIWGWLSVK